MMILTAFMGVSKDDQICHYTIVKYLLRFITGRIIDRDFGSIGGGLVTAIAIDDNPHWWRAYYVAKDYGLMERTGGNPDYYYSGIWLRSFDSPKPDVLGGAVAAVTWKNNIRVFYVSERSLIEVMLSFTTYTYGEWSTLGKIA
jgi:hypothetical protein